MYDSKIKIVNLLAGAKAPSNLALACLSSSKSFVDELARQLVANIERSINRKLQPNDFVVVSKGLDSRDLNAAQRTILKWNWRWSGELRALTKEELASYCLTLRETLAYQIKLDVGATVCFSTGKVPGFPRVEFMTAELVAKHSGHLHCDPDLRAHAKLYNRLIDRSPYILYAACGVATGLDGWKPQLELFHRANIETLDKMAKIVPPAEALRYFCNAVSGAQYLVNQGLRLMDMGSLSNIAIDLDDGCGKLFDFDGLVFADSMQRSFLYKPFRHDVPPEVLSNRSESFFYVTPAMMVYQLGNALRELCNIWQSNNHDAGNAPCYNKAREVSEAMRNRHSHRRPSLREVLWSLS